MLQILWLLASPLLAHGIGESGFKNDYRLIICVGAADTNQIWWIYTNPFTGSLLHPR